MWGAGVAHVSLFRAKKEDDESITAAHAYLVSNCCDNGGCLASLASHSIGVGPVSCLSAA